MARNAEQVLVIANSKDRLQHKFIWHRSGSWLKNRNEKKIKIKDESADVKANKRL